MREGVVVEQELASTYFREARRELPDEALVPARLVVEDAAFDGLTRRMARGLAALV